MHTGQIDDEAEVQTMIGKTKLCNSLFSCRSLSLSLSLSPSHPVTLSLSTHMHKHRYMHKLHIHTVRFCAKFRARFKESISINRHSVHAFFALYAGMRQPCECVLTHLHRSKCVLLFVSFEAARQSVSHDVHVNKGTYTHVHTYTFTVPR